MDGDRILIINMGGEQAYSVARRVRSIHVFCEVETWPVSADILIRRNIRGLILAGDSANVSVSPDCAVFRAGLPVLALGGCARVVVEAFGGQISGNCIENSPCQISFGDSPLFEGLQEGDRFLQHADEILLPEGFAVIATADGCTPALADEAARLYGLQFYPESNDPDGLTIIRNFSCGICGCEDWWSIEEFIRRMTDELRTSIGDRRVLMEVSGGVDSSVCAALLSKAIGDNLTCLFIDTGFLRKNEADTVEHAFLDEMNIRLVRIDAHQRFLDALKGVESPLEKRAIISRELKRTAEANAAALGGFELTADGTIYTDKTETLADLSPLKHLFKSEVRQAGEILGIPTEFIRRQSFPDPGLAIRIIGPVTQERLDMLREADAIFREEIREADLSKRIARYFAVLFSVPTGGISESGSEEETLISLRAVSSNDSTATYAYRLPYDLLERVSQRITENIPGVGRVLYDISGKSSATVDFD